jgi:hypothetical protein
MPTEKPARKTPPKPAAKDSGGDIFVLRIDLARLKPAIWRRVEVPGTITLYRLHQVLQIAFDWTDSHLHGFAIGTALYGPGDSDSFGFGVQEHDERKSRLGEVAAAGDRFTYTYDFGDDWIHGIKVEKVTKPMAGLTYPRCTAGKNAAPPEDCGGPWGYAEMLQTLSEPVHPEREEMLEWLGDDFDPKACDLEEINVGLARLKL